MQRRKMNSLELYNQIYAEIISLQEAQNLTQEEYVLRFGEPEDNDDYESMQYYFLDIDRDLSWMYESLYYKLVFFFEQEKQFTILNDFLNKFKIKMFDPQEIRKKYRLEDFDVEVFSLIEELRVFFSVFNKMYLKENEGKNGIDLFHKDNLEILLRSLDFYFHNSSISKEKDFFNGVNKLIRTFYPDCQDLQNIQFVKKLKSYIPDIFIPKCKSILELKYADTKEIFKSCIESIDTDTVGYSDNENYKYFYVLFYCTEMFFSTDEMEIIWKERNYPENWKYFIVRK
jgi:hypothetical protein